MTLIPNLSLIRVSAEPDGQSNRSHNSFDGQRRLDEINTTLQNKSEDKPLTDRIDHRINFLLVRTLKELSHRLSTSSDIWEEISTEMNCRLPLIHSITANECQIRYCRLFCKYSSALKRAKTRTEAVDSFEFFNTFSELDLKSLLSKTDNNLINLIRDFIQN